MNINNTKKPLEFNIKLDRKIILFLVLYLLLVFLSPILLTQITTIIGFNQDTGVIGDTIGGITAPFINLLAAFLVYISFREQIKANRELNKENEFSYISKLFEMVKSDFYENDLKEREGFEEKNNIAYIKKWLDASKDLSIYAHYVYGFVDAEVIDSESARNSSINSEIEEPLIALRNSLWNLNNLIKEIKNSNLEHGFKAIYRFQIEKIFEEMGIWYLIHPHMLGQIDEEILNQNNRAHFREIKWNAECISKKGYTIINKLEG